MKVTSDDKAFVSSLKGGNYVQGEPISIPREGIISDGVTAITPYGIFLLSEGKINYKPIDLNEMWVKNLGFTLESVSKFESFDTQVKRITKIYSHKDDVVHNIKVEIVYDGDEKELRRIGIKCLDVFTNLIFINKVHEFQNIFEILANINLKL